MAFLGGRRLSYGWVVVAVCLTIGTLTLGTRYSFGVFFKSIDSEFGLSRTLTSGIPSANMVFCAVFSIIGGWALDRYGPRRVVAVMGLLTGVSLVLVSLTTSPWQMFFTYSVLMAAGTGPGYVVLSATSSRWFSAKRGLAVAVATGGSGLGPAIAAPVATFLISKLEWRGAYAVMGIVSGVMMVALSGLLRSAPVAGPLIAPPGNPPGPIPQAAASASLTLRQAFRTRSFWLFVASWLFYALAFNMIATHIIPHATDIGISGANAAVILTLIGGMSLPARILMGGVSDRIGRKNMAIACGLMQAGATLWLIGLRELLPLYVFAVVYGIGYGGYDAPVTALIGDTFGVRNLGVIIGGAAAGWAMGAAAGPAIGGYAFDVTGSYSLAFLASAVAMFASTMCVVFTKKEVD